MSDLDKPIRIKKRVETMKADKLKSQGALSQVMKQIKSEFACSSVEDAEKELKILQKDLSKSKDKLVAETKRLEIELDAYEY